MAYQMDFFAGIESKVLAAVGNKVQYPAYIFVRDEEDSKTGRLAFVDQNNEIKFIRGENKQYILNVNTLPDISEGDIDVLYIVDEAVYMFNGKEYVSINGISIDDFEALIEKVSAIEKDVATKASTDEVKNAIESVISYSDKVYEKVKFEIFHKPEGTLVDYREQEIRVMCPADMKFEKQSVGSTGNPNMHYMGFKAYAPDGATSFKEGDQGVIIDEMLTFDYDFAGTDEFGRNYSVCWLPLATCNESGEWTYFGKNSTTEKYIGWTYVVEWYDVNGKVIGYDSIRINLSNENCHYTVEPYYIHNMSKEVTEKFTTLETTDKELVNKVLELEDIIKNFENEYPSFVELE